MAANALFREPAGLNVLQFSGLLLARTWKRHHPVWNGERRGALTIDHKAPIFVIPGVSRMA